MIDIEMRGMAEAEQTYKRLRDGVDRSAYVAREAAALHVAKLLADASPIGNYDDEPGHQPVPRRPGELAASWTVIALNQYTVAVVSTVWYSKLLLFDVEKGSWLIQKNYGQVGRGGIGNQKEDIVKRYSENDKGMNLYFRGRGDGKLVMVGQVNRQAQAQNEEMQAALKLGEVDAAMMTRNLFGVALQDYVQVR